MKGILPQGFLLAIEGLDGAGKSVQARAVGAVLQARGLDVVLTHEPTSGPWGQRLRESARHGRLAPADELHAFVEDRRQHVRELIAPSLAAGKVVITDRYYFSTVAYQGARGFDPTELLRANEAFAPEPHLLVLLQLTPEQALARVGNRDGRANEFETLAQLTRTRAIFDALEKPYILRLDGTRPVEDLRDDILFALSRAVIERLARMSQLTSRERLAALTAFHGMPTSM
ncbi:MAG: dTMP kinase [Verrucomicrobia bacterium]|nr:dTMP kinase [Verrucomicrobiota bacterium]